MKLIKSAILLFAACLPFGAYAANATVFALKRGQASARTETSTRVLSPGIDIPEQALVKVTEGVLGVKLPDGSSLYFLSGSTFRLVLPTDGSAYEVILLAGSVAVSSDGDLVVRTTTGIADIGATTSVVTYSPGASSAPGTLVIRTTKGSARVTPIGGKVLTVEKSMQLILPAAASAASESLQPTQVVAVNAAVSGDAHSLRSASSVPDWATPKADPVPKAESTPKFSGPNRALDSREP